MCHNSVSQVSWIRVADVSLLAVGGYTYTSDLRLESLHSPGSPDWTLVIRNLTVGDAGQYECQVSTTPHMSLLVNLNIRGECGPSCALANLCYHGDYQDLSNEYSHYLPWP